jgi:hypothetical protein
LRWDLGPGLPNQAVLVDFQRTRLYVFSAVIEIGRDTTHEARVLLTTISRERHPVEFAVTDIETGLTVVATDLFIPVEGGR